MMNCEFIGRIFNEVFLKLQILSTLSLNFAILLEKLLKFSQLEKFKEKLLLNY